MSEQPPAELRDRIKRLDEVDIDDIVDFEAGNPVDRTDADREQLDASLNINGYVMPVLVRELANGKLENLDGHGRIERIREKFPNTKRLKVIVLDVENAAEGRKVLLGLRHQAKWNMSELEVWAAAALKEGIALDEAMALSAMTAADLDAFANAGTELLDQLLETPGGDAPPPPSDDSGASAPRPLSSAERAARVFIFSKEAIADACFAHYRREGFPFPNPSPAECMLSINRLASMTMDQLVRTHEGGAVADKFQPHRFAAIADGMVSPHDAFHDDKKLRYTIDMIVDSTGSIGDGTLRSMLGMVQGAQSCSNFRPGFAAYLYRRFCEPGGTILDTSHGYGGRLVGALASTVVAHYIGIDPNTPSLEGSRRLLKLLGRENFATLIEKPAEEVDPSPWAGTCSFAFTSPPYFNKERYSDAPTQSGNKFPTADGWREGFLVPMMALQFASLKRGGHAAVNIAEVLVEGIRHPLGDWTIAAALRAGFEHVGTLDFPIGGSRAFGGMKNTEKAEQNAEPVFLFRKP